MFLINQSGRLKTALSTVLVLPLSMAFGLERTYTAMDDGHPGFLNLLNNGVEDVPVKSFVLEDENQKTKVIGIRFPAAMIQQLPAWPGRGIDGETKERNNPEDNFTDQKLCFDKNENGVYDELKECAAGYRSFFPLKDASSPRPNQPFNFIQFAWNPLGYADPSHIYALPLVGVHFYFTSMEKVNSIKPGGFEAKLDEDSFNKAVQEVPENLLPPRRYLNVFPVPRMGGHLLDLDSDSLPNYANFNLIYGAYEGKPIFIEPIVRTNYLQRVQATHNFPFDDFDQTAPFIPEERKNSTNGIQPPTYDLEQCEAVPVMQEVLEPGYYPQRYCVTYIPEQQTFEITIRDFIFQQGKTVSPTAPAEQSSSTSALYPLGALLLTVAGTALTLM